MEMAIDKAIKMLIAKEQCIERETSGIDTDCNNHNCDNCDLCYEQGNMGEQKETLKYAVEIMRKYKTMQEVLEKVWNVPSCMLDKADCLNKIMETYRTVR